MPPRSNNKPTVPAKRSLQQMQDDSTNTSKRGTDTIESSSKDIVVSLQNEETATILDVFRALREQGIEDDVSLSQLVVGGDTSSGKSAVLSRLTGLAFPSSMDVETRFATEVILRTAKQQSTTIIIDPDNSRSPDQVQKLKGFRWRATTTSEFQRAHQQASDALEQYSDGTGKLLMDRVVISISGPSKQPLAIVDLPGLIQSAIGSITELDKRRSHDIVEKYFKNPRTIILAVIAADNSVLNQQILEKARNTIPRAFVLWASSRSQISRTPTRTSSRGG
jgi:energy-coupling factor transporter ATP-binding protein EcfA2